MEHRLLTYSGIWLDLENPTPDMITIKDIAIGLSRESRFNGHTEKFYSVAQHSVLCSRLVPEWVALEALLHDATEAYLKDIPTPLKDMLPEYKKIEQRLDAVIRRAFGFPELQSFYVKDADNEALLHEMSSFTKHQVDSDHLITKAWGPKRAYREFWNRFHELRGIE